MRALDSPVSVSGSTAVADAAYNNQDFKSSITPKPLVIDALLNAVAHFAQVIAETKDHTWRGYFLASTANIANKSDIPHLSGGFPILGLRQGPFDATDGTLLTERSAPYIERCRRLSYDVYHYRIIGTRLHHTRADAFFNICRFDAATERAAATTATGNMILPDTLEEAVMAHALAQMVVYEQFAGQAAYYGQYALVCEKAIRAGSDVMPSLGQQ
jgi:hypothetical protein